MTFFEFLTNNKSVINTLFRNGVVSGTIVRDYEIYKYYQDLRNLAHSKTVSIATCQVKFKVSRKKMYLLLNKMEELV